MKGTRWSNIQRLQNDNVIPIDGIPTKVGIGVATAAMFVQTTSFTGSFGGTAIPSSNFRIIWPIPILETNNNQILLAQQNPN